MKIVVRLVMAAALLALGLWLWTVLFPGPEKIILKRLAEVARSASFSANEGTLARLADIHKLASHFSRDVEIIFDAAGHGQQTLNGRDELVQAVTAEGSRVTALQVEFLDASIELAADKQSAVVDLTVKARLSADKDFTVQEMKITMKKINDDWLITRAETVKTLS